MLMIIKYDLDVIYPYDLNDNILMKEYIMHISHTLAN